MLIISQLWLANTMQVNQVDDFQQYPVILGDAWPTEQPEHQFIYSSWVTCQPAWMTLLTTCPATQPTPATSQPLHASASLPSTADPAYWALHWPHGQGVSTLLSADSSPACADRCQPSQRPTHTTFFRTNKPTLSHYFDKTPRFFFFIEIFYFQYKELNS